MRGKLKEQNENPPTLKQLKLSIKRWLYSLMWL